jgi:alkylhydroperoxidase family enzyme
MLPHAVARLLKEIPWGEPVVPIVHDPEFAADLKKVMGMDAPNFHMLSRSKWLRTVILRVSTVRTSYLSERLALLASLVTAQENSCRFCYGNARAFLKMLGLSEKEIDAVEHDVKTAGADDNERELLHFCRDLSRSNPRPARAQFDRLVSMGYDPRAMVEIAMIVGGACMNNRVATFLAVPLVTELENYSPSFFKRLMAPVWRLMHPAPPPPPPESLAPVTGPFAEIVSLMKGTVGVVTFHDALVGAFASPVLPVRTKAWVFAVVARALDCQLCERGAARILSQEGVGEEVRRRVLEALAGPDLDATEKVLLPWVRETAHYQTEVMQRRTYELRERVGEEVVLEVVGLAALANACSRVSMLAQ